MPRGDGLSPHKNLRRSTRDHAQLYTSLDENHIEMNDDDFEPRRTSRRSRDRRAVERREMQRRSSVTRFGRKINHSRYYDDYVDHYSPEEDPHPRSERNLTYRQQLLVAINDSKRVQKDRERNSDSDRKHIDESASGGSGGGRRKRVLIDEDDMDDDDGNLTKHKPENTPEHDEPVIRRSTRRNPSLQPRSSIEPDEKEESPIRRSARRTKRIESDEKPETSSQEPEDVEMKENGVDGGEKDGEAKIEEGIDDEEDEDEKEEEESSTSEEEEEEYQKPRQYSLRQRRPAVVTFEQEQAQAREMRSRRAIARNDGRVDRSGSVRRNIGRHHRSRPAGRRMRSDSDSSDDGRFNRKDRKHHLDRSRFMPINMTEKEITSVEHIVQERVRKTGGGQGSSDIDPMAIDESVGFDQVGGLGAHIQSLKEVVLFPMLYPEIFAKFNINPPKGVVFYGPPGTGKTLVARALANECRKGASKVAFFMRKGADCLSKWVGESERQLRLLFDQAYAMRPSIIFFDEIDGLAPVRSTKQDQIHASIVSTLLALMDGLDSRGEVVVIGATNRLDTLDPALRRPGRFDRELRFSLPDLNARKQILDIHTSKWNENKPDEDTIKTIAEKTSGYCGADLKFLCTESVLIALRARYPHIYMCSERLKLDVGSIQVTKEHFSHAMRRITPASRRDLSIPSRPLDERTSILLGDIVDNLISIRIPHGYRCVESPASTAGTELEKVVRALEPHPTVPSIRLLICGSMAVSDGGQTSYVMPAILSKLDHLPVFSLSVSSLLNDGRPEEAFSHAVQAAMRASTTGPCIMLLPSIDEWIKVVPVSVQHMLITCLESMTGFTPILFLASLDSSFEEAPDYVKEVFRHANCAATPPARRVLREKYFEHIFEPVFRPPKVFDASQYVKPEVETAANAPATTRKLSEAEARELEKMYLSLLRQMRIFLRDRLNRFIRDRRFVDFVMPVDKEDAEDYYEIIETPMCLTDMMEKLDSKQYIHADQFLDDVRLITLNALEYNPAMTQDGRTIRNMAIGLRDVAEELFDSELDENFVNNLETTSRLLQEAGIVPEDEVLIEIPTGFTRKSPWSIKNSLKSEIERWKKEKEKEAKKNGTFVDEVKNEENATTSSDTVPIVKHATKRKRSKSYNFPGQKKRKIARSSQPVGEGDHSDGEETEDDMTVEDEETENNTPERHVNGVDMEMLKNGDDSSTQSQQDPIETGPLEKEGELVVSKAEIDELIGFCIEKSEGWSVSELERLASVMSHKIEQYRTKWNRSCLAGELTTIVANWQPTIREDSDDSMNISPVKNGAINGLQNGH